ncbi:MAG: hypothetical protein WBV28_22430 [Terracidiphilus sp.]
MPRFLFFVLGATIPLLPPFAPAQTSAAGGSLPDAPQPKTAAPAQLPVAGACQVRSEGGILVATAAAKGISMAGFGDVSAQLTNQPVLMTVPCPLYVPIVNWYARFLDGPKVKPLTPKEKAWLAVRNVGDPFNAITILGISAISVAADSHSPYGPGMPGFGRSVGVSYTQDMTGEFIGTFLLPSITHQDPHYHRMPSASVTRRILHCIAQVAWTQGDNGKGMPNYSTLVGSAIEDEIGNLYVPGRSTNLPASAARYSINLALDPTDNFITEFLPDLATHIHVHAVFVQRIIDQVAKSNGGSGT